MTAFQLTEQINIIKGILDVLAKNETNVDTLSSELRKHMWTVKYNDTQTLADHIRSMHGSVKDRPDTSFRSRWINFLRNDKREYLQQIINRIQREELNKYDEDVWDKFSSLIQRQPNSHSRINTENRPKRKRSLLEKSDKSSRSGDYDDSISPHDISGTSSSGNKVITPSKYAEHNNERQVFEWIRAVLYEKSFTMSSEAFDEIKSGSLLNTHPELRAMAGEKDLMQLMIHMDNQKMIDLLPPSSSVQRWFTELFKLIKETQTRSGHE